MMHAVTKIAPKSWLAFELNVLRRLNFSSVAIPFNPSPAIGAYLKRWNVRVAANDALTSAYTRCVAQILNSGERLTNEDIDRILEDAYVPGYRLANPALTGWFSETDAWWFDNVRRNIERLDTPITKALGASVALAAGQYVMSFSETTREFRQPLSNAFRRLSSIEPVAAQNGRNNTVSNKLAEDFVTESFAELLFLRLPMPHANGFKANLGRSAWAEEWIRGGNDFWPEYEAMHSGNLGGATNTKSQYLRHVEELLRRAGHLKSWAIAHIESGSITTQELVETISKIRRVDTVYTKDFSELTGTKAVIITA
jgi:hypothetical protein